MCLCVYVCVFVCVCMCGRNDRFRFQVKLVPLYATYRLAVSPYTSGSSLCLGIPLILVCNSCTGLRGKNYLFRPSCYHNGTVLYSSDALFFLLKMLTNKFREVNWYSGQVWERAPLDIELIHSVVVVVVVIIPIILFIAYYRSLFITRPVNTCQNSNFTISTSYFCKISVNITYRLHLPNNFFFVCYRALTKLF